jgi:hypothetical protein
MMERRKASDFVGRKEDGWVVWERPGFFGRSGAERWAAYSEQFGSDGCDLWYAWGERILRRELALQLYEDAYWVYFQQQPETLEWLVKTASEVYDTALSNIQSGLDYQAQEGGATHLQDISIRRVLLRMARCFEGDHPVRIRGRRSEGYRLNPGQVPFHHPEQILTPRLQGWWRKDTIEDFWQSNKLLVVRQERLPQS